MVKVKCLEDPEERRERTRRKEDVLFTEEFVRMEDLLAYVKKDDLETIIKDTVKFVLESYQHKCIMDLRAEDVGAVRDLVGALREVGDDKTLAGAVSVIRDNHKFVKALQRSAMKIGWGVIILSISIMGALGLLAAGVLKQSGGS